MIQRLQSLYLLIVLLLSLLFFGGAVFNFTDESGKAIQMQLSGNLTDQAGQSLSQAQTAWPIAGLLILISALSLITIFLFKNRKVQLLLAMAVILAATGLIIALAYYAISLMHAFRLTIIPGFKMAIPVLNLIFSVLAYRGILKDDRLVKSYDRLR
jgi:hypothetical protein